MNLSKQNRKELGRLWAEYEVAVASLRSADEEATACINAAAAVFRQVIDAVVESLDVSDVNSAREALLEEIDSIASDFDMDFEEKSEKWQEGDAGQEARVWIDALRAAGDELVEISSPSVDYSTVADEDQESVVDLSDVVDAFAPLEEDVS